MQLVDTSSALETLKLKVLKELKNNNSIKREIEKSHLNKIKDRAKYDEDFITEKSLNIIKFKRIKNESDTI